MAQDILITPGSGEPQILFRGSGTNDTAVELNVLSSYQSATGSGTALIFEGTEGQLFGITDNLSSGTIFSVSDITGLPLIEADASGDVTIGEYGNITLLQGNKVGFFDSSGVIQQSGVNSTAGHTQGFVSEVYEDSTFTGGVGSTTYTIDDIVKALKNYGLLQN